MSVNKVILIGRLGQNPEVKYTPSGAAVANFSIATNESWLDKAGQKQERTEWHRVTVWGKLAELCGQYLAKGRQAYIEGRLQTRQWQDKDGQTKYSTEVQATTVQFLGAGAGAGNEQQRPATTGNQNWQQNSGGSGQGRDAGGFDGGPDFGSGSSGGAGFSGPRPSQQEPTFTEDDIPF